MAAAVLGGAVVGGLISQGGTILGHKGAQKDYAAAEKQLTDFQVMLHEFINREYAKSDPLRQQALDTSAASGRGLADFERVARDPTTSPQFQLLAREGLRSIQGDFSTGGDPASGPAQLAAGRYMVGLGASERERQDRNLAALSGLQFDAASAYGRPGQQNYDLYPTLADIAKSRANIRVGRGNETSAFYQRLGEQGADTANASGKAVGGLLG
jgi:hypothetical protein